MVGLIDIAPRAETVEVQGAPVAVHGISAKGVAHLLGRFPELRKLMSDQEVETNELMAMGDLHVSGIHSSPRSIGISPASAGLLFGAPTTARKPGEHRASSAIRASR